MTAVGIPTRGSTAIGRRIIIASILLRLTLLLGMGTVARTVAVRRRRRSSSGRRRDLPVRRMSLMVAMLVIGRVVVRRRLSWRWRKRLLRTGLRLLVRGVASCSCRPVLPGGLV